MSAGYFCAVFCAVCMVLAVCGLLVMAALAVSADWRADRRKRRELAEREGGPVVRARGVFVRIW